MDSSAAVGSEVFSRVGMATPFLELAVQTTLHQHLGLVRPLAVEPAGTTVLLQLWRKPVPMRLAALIGLVGAAIVLQRGFPAFLAMNGVILVAVRALAAGRQRWREAVVCIALLLALFLIGRAQGWNLALLGKGPLSLRLLWTCVRHRRRGRAWPHRCIGFGIERLALAVLAQHGTEPKDWPRVLREPVARGT